MRSQSYASTQNAGKALHKKDYAVESTLQLEDKPQITNICACVESPNLSSKYYKTLLDGFCPYLTYVSYICVVNVTRSSVPVLIAMQ